VLKAGKLRLRYPMMSFNFCLGLIFQTHYGFGSTQPLTEMSARSLLEGERRPAPKAGNTTSIC
jgi:hypothetical protein